MDSLHPVALARALLLAVLLALALVPLAHAQPAPNDPVDFHLIPGTLIARGSNQAPVGPDNLTSYVIERLDLPWATVVQIEGQDVVVGTAWRITVLGGPFQVRALPPTVWLDGVPIGYGQESIFLDAVTAITFDGSLIHDGASIGLSYGENGGPVLLPETLTLAVWP